MNFLLRALVRLHLRRPAGLWLALAVWAGPLPAEAAVPPATKAAPAAARMAVAPRSTPP